MGLIRRKLKSKPRRIDFITKMADKLENSDEIDSQLYPKYNVKRGLRNANGTGVVVGLTKIGEAAFAGNRSIPSADTISKIL